MKTNEIKLLAEDCTPIHDERIKQIPCKDTDEVFENIIYRIDGEKILDIAKKILPKKSYEILLKRYGFYDGYAWSLEMIGEEINLSRDRVRKINAKSLQLLRYYIKNQERRKHD